MPLFSKKNFERLGALRLARATPGVAESGNTVQAYKWHLIIKAALSGALFDKKSSGCVSNLRNGARSFTLFTRRPAFYSRSLQQLHAHFFVSHPQSFSERRLTA